ncbi:hypothetical protein MKZ38_000976 [Zalerion maritima]|uniref:Methyltransferase domain-containing protein n=1 Tax=Zalerion maritima TaxID=339359 RepID=A0AAD5WRS8_9PEZI|nr:hypothetical protein MKZ38_000976 [Zalerion maritima]
MLTSAPADLKSRLASSYDSIADVYNKWALDNSSTRLSYLSKLLSHLCFGLHGRLSRPVRILDLGGGCGDPVTKSLLEHDANISIVLNDMSPAQISKARDMFHSDVAKGRLQLEEGDMTTLSFGSEEFDAIMGTYSLIHLPRDQQTLMLGLISGWLKPGGLVLATFLEEETTGMVMDKWMGDGGWMFWSSWGKERTLELVKGNGFEVLLEEVPNEGEVDARFLWVLGRKEE